LGDPSGFQATTQGLARVIVPMNERTQLPTQAAIAAAIATAPVGRFVWLTQQEGSASGYEQAIAPLFVAAAKAWQAPSFRRKRSGGCTAFELE